MNIHIIHNDNGQVEIQDKDSGKVLASFDNYADAIQWLEKSMRWEDKPVKGTEHWVLVSGKTENDDS